MRAMPLILLLWLAACGPSDPVEKAAPVATKATPAVVPAASSGGKSEGDRSAPPAVAELAGRWRVTGVAVAEGPVSAVSVDDPALMGAVLSITPERLAWEPHDGGFFTDRCPEPQIGPDGSVGCGEGQFGPPDMRIVRTGDRLRIDWYDGAILTLSRIA